jgi:hypothetical protein
MLVSWRVRLTHWEYWPPWVTYVPVAAYALWLILKYRSVTAFTAANPAIVASGFNGESKIDILRGLGASRDRVARSGLIDRALSVDAKIARAEQVMRAHTLDLPVVLKPNEGQRGAGVVVARTRPELIAYLQHSCGDVIVQEYVPGLEFGVFYVRRPSESRGRILSITDKRLPAVVGDGQRTLEQLILTDRRTLGMARFHLRRHADAHLEIPARGQIVSLGDCGSHCRGATFLDARSRVTPELERAFDDVARAYDGFYFGRFDVRVPSVEAFAAGRGFKILELNGVTSEATHIYDPDVSVLDAYRALFEQWRLAFEIGAENIARGATATSVMELARLVGRYRTSSRRWESVDFSSRRYSV